MTLPRLGTHRDKVHARQSDMDMARPASGSAPMMSAADKCSLILSDAKHRERLRVELGTTDFPRVALQDSEGRKTIMCGENGPGADAKP